MAGPARYMADLSNNNPHFNAREYRSAGHRVVAIKATEGVGGRQKARGALLPPVLPTGFPNPRSDRVGQQSVFTSRVDLAHAAGLYVIHYHFARPDHHLTSAAEAKDFLAFIRPHVRRGDRVALDLEVEPAHGVDLNRYVLDFANAVRHAIGHKHGWLYSYTDFIRRHGLRTPPGWRLWLADYSPPVGGKRAGVGTPWTHQYTNGVVGPHPRSIEGVGVSDVSQLSRRAAIGLRVSPR